MICIDEKEIIKRTDRMVVNRYNFNKPYGFIEMNFNYDITAIEKLEWESDKKNIIWLDYDEFLSPTMLESLEKCIKLTSSGSLIILSVSMGQKPEDRLERFKANFNIGEEFSDYDDFLEEDEFATGDWYAKGIEETYRITDDIGLKDCDSSTIHSTLYKIIDKTVQIALNKKNRHRENSEPEYKIQQIFNCVYSDGVPMFTYGIIVYSSLDKEDDENFPTNVLSEYPWLKTNQEKYEIEIPILTHKEVNAINQLLPDNDAKAIKELLPFIPLSDIKKYVNIYRYYPHFFEVGDYV